MYYVYNIIIIIQCVIDFIIIVVIIYVLAMSFERRNYFADAR